MSNLFGQGSNRGLLGHATDYLFNNVFSYDRQKALQNAQTRAGNAYDLGGGFMNAVSAFYSPNRTQTGNAIYNVPTMVSDASYSSKTASPSGALPQSFTLEGGTSGSGGTTFVPTTFQGVTYNTQQELDAARLAYYQQQHDQYAKSLTDAYNAGLITFDERKTALEQNRQDLINSKNAGLGAVQASYAQASPDVIQSSQNDYQNNINNQFDTANTQIGTANDTATSQTAYGDIARNRQAYDTQYANNQQTNDQNLVNQQDATANDLANWNASQAASGSSVPNTIDTNQLLAGLASTYSNMIGQGFTPEETQQSLKAGLSKGGVNAKQVDPILAYFYNNFLPRYTKATGG